MKKNYGRTVQGEKIFGSMYKELQKTEAQAKVFGKINKVYTEKIGDDHDLYFRVKARSFDQALYQVAMSGVFAECSHTHDCCGCFFGTLLEARRVKSHEYSVKVHRARNI